MFRNHVALPTPCMGYTISWRTLVSRLLHFSWADPVSSVLPACLVLELHCRIFSMPHVRYKYTGFTAKASTYPDNPNRNRSPKISNPVISWAISVQILHVTEAHAHATSTRPTIRSRISVQNHNHELLLEIMNTVLLTLTRIVFKDTNAMLLVWYC